MTSEEIKRTVFMEELVERYGLYPNRAGFIVCPFHKGDRNASLKIYKDSFYCFGCGAAGDVFDFVRKMDGMLYREKKNIYIFPEIKYIFLFIDNKTHVTLLQNSVKPHK